MLARPDKSLKLQHGPLEITEHSCIRFDQHKGIESQMFRLRLAVSLVALSPPSPQPFVDDVRAVAQKTPGKDPSSSA
jgi:hypothetical protein